VSGALAAQLTSIVYTTIAASALLHGISVTPLMNRYEKKMHASREDSARDASQGRKELSGI
jgi:NhaP-type Na+/H+ or K+/H+ antiporter